MISILSAAFSFRFCFHNSLLLLCVHSFANEKFDDACDDAKYSRSLTRSHHCLCRFITFIFLRYENFSIGTVKLFVVVRMNEFFIRGANQSYFKCDNKHKKICFFLFRYTQFAWHCLHSECVLCQKHVECENDKLQKPEFCIELFSINECSQRWQPTATNATSRTSCRTVDDGVHRTVGHATHNCIDEFPIFEQRTKAMSQWFMSWLKINQVDRCGRRYISKLIVVHFVVRLINCLTRIRRNHKSWGWDQRRGVSDYIAQNILLSLYTTTRW